MCFDRNINGNRDVKFLECDYLLLHQFVKLTLANYFGAKIQIYALSEEETLTGKMKKKRMEEQRL